VLIFIPKSLDVIHDETPVANIAIIFLCVILYYVPANLFPIQSFHIFYKDHNKVIEVTEKELASLKGKEADKKSLDKLKQKLGQAEQKKVEASAPDEIDEDPSLKDGEFKLKQSWAEAFLGIFLHAGFFHLLFNMVFLWIFGNAICSNIGNLKYTILFLATGVFATALHRSFNSTPVVGASGAIMGIVGFFLALYPFNKVNVLMVLWMIFRPLFHNFQVASYILILFWFGGDVLGAALGRGNVAYWAHIGGFIAGVTAGLAALQFKLIHMTEFDNITLLDKLKGKERQLLAPDQPLRPHIELPNLAPAPAEIPLTSDPEEWLAKGRKFLQEKQFTNAMLTFEDILSRSPRSVATLIELVRTYRLRGEHQKVHATLNRLMNAYLSDSNFREAVRLLNMTKANMPDHQFNPEQLEQLRRRVI
jgi:membrane associated rhomboid family serine protease